MDWPRSQFGSQGLVVIAVLLFVLLALLTREWATRWSRRRRWSRARFAESTAPSLLAQFGYEVLGAQVPGQYTLSVDGQAVSVPLRVDFIVARGGRQYIAEVKSGRSAPLLSTSATRRQLLEYLLAFPVDGVLLVDAENRRIHEVRFPIPWNAQRQRTGSWVFAVAILVLIAAVAFYWFSS